VVVGVTSLHSETNSSSFIILVQNNLFCSVFTYEELLMIYFGQVCVVDAYVPLYLVDELVNILTEECNCVL